MAITFWWLGHATMTTARVCVRGTTTGAVTATCNGATFAGAIDATARDGVATIDITGLYANGSFPVTIQDASGATSTGTVKTMPSANGKVAFISCQDRQRSHDDLSQNIVAFGANAVIHQGDYIYLGAAGSNTVNGEIATAVATGSLPSDYAKHWRLCKRQSARRLIETSLPYYQGFDDHEFGGGNWDHTVKWAQNTTAGDPNVGVGDTDTGGLGLNSGTNTEASWWASRQCVAWYSSGNPTNTDAEAAASTDKPSIVAASYTQYPVAYYRVTVGDIEVFHIDVISYRDPTAKTDNASKTMLGASQKAWLKARLAASTAPFKIIASGKTTYSTISGGTGDDWLKYTAERDELITWIAANVTGCVWICGDAHNAFVTYDPARGHIAICANPAGVDHIVQTAGYTTFTVWKEQGHSGASTTLPACFGLAEAGNGVLTLRLIDQYGGEMWRGAVAAGTNVLMGVS